MLSVCSEVFPERLTFVSLLRWASIRVMAASPSTLSEVSALRDTFSLVRASKPARLSSPARCLSLHSIAVTCPFETVTPSHEAGFLRSVILRASALVAAFSAG